MGLSLALCIYLQWYLTVLPAGPSKAVLSELCCEVVTDPDLKTALRFLCPRGSSYG